MVDYRFTLELTDYTVQKRITVTQGEVAARKFIVNFSENGKPYALNPYSRVVFRMTTPTGKNIFNHCVVDGNTVEVIPTSVSIADSGLCDARFEVYGNDSDMVLYSPKIEFYIAENSYDDSKIEGSNEFRALQTALNDVTDLMVELGGPEGVLERAAEQVDLAKAEVDNAKVQVDLAKAEAVKAEEQAEIAGVHAYEALLKSGEASRSVAEADRFAGEAATYANTARELAEITEIAKNEAVESVTAAANSEAGAKKAKEDAEIAASAAGSSEHQAQIYRDQAKDYAETAYSYLDQTRNEAQKVKTIIAEELPVYTTLYKNDTPDWVSHDESSVDPYSSGKDVYFKADIKAGEKYVVRFSMEHQEGYDDIIVLLSTKNSGDYNDRIFEHKYAFYNEVNKCYEVDYTANRNSIKDEELMLFVGYPYSSSATDFDASFGWVHILHKENLQSIVDNQNIKIAAIGEDVETALDGIITLQENLIGGDTV